MKKSILSFFILFSLISISKLKDLSRDELLHRTEIVRKINSMQTTWKAELNPTDVRPLLGVWIDQFQDNSEEKLFIPTRDIVPREDLPENFDLREAYPYCDSLFQIRDQANCGSCWAVASAATMSDRVCIGSKGQQKPIISSGVLISCCQLCGSGCSGGIPSQAFIWWKGAGLPTGGPYEDKNTCSPYFLPPCNHHVNGTVYPDCPPSTTEPECVQECQEGYPKTFTEDKFYCDEYYTVKGEAQLMTEIYERGSIQANFLVYEDFPNYKSGVYKYTTGELLGGHAIKIIGWGVENGIKYWLCVNSWNEFWGDHGTFKIVRGENECHIESNIATGTAKLN